MSGSNTAAQKKHRKLKIQTRSGQWSAKSRECSYSSSRNQRETNSYGWETYLARQPGRDRVVENSL